MKIAHMGSQTTKACTAQRQKAPEYVLNLSHGLHRAIDLVRQILLRILTIAQCNKAIN